MLHIQNKKAGRFGDEPQISFDQYDEYDDYDEVGSNQGNFWCFIDQILLTLCQCLERIRKGLHLDFEDGMNPSIDLAHVFMKAK